ncbi:MAG: GNAT family N-acetyltransferase [Pseudomonadota bacterium]
MSKVSIYERFEDLPEPCVALFDKTSAVSGVFCSLPWFRHLAATVFDKNQRLRIYTVESDHPALVLPMCEETPSKGVLAARKLTAIANFYTAVFSPLVAEPERGLQQNLHLVAGAIAADRPRWDTVDLHPMEEGTALFDGTLDAFRRAGMAAHSYFCFGNWYLEVKHRSYGEYFDSLPSKLKNTLKRKSRQLEDGGRLQIDLIAGGPDLAQAIAAYEKIYQSSWKIPEVYPDFIPGLIHVCAAQGWLRMGVAYIDGQPAAAQIWIVSQGVASIYKLAYDEQFSKFSVGSILTARLMQHVIDTDLVREVDFLSGDDPYKQDWMSHRRERRGIIAFNLRTVHGVFAALRHAAGQTWKNIAARRTGA